MKVEKVVKFNVPRYPVFTGSVTFILDLFQHYTFSFVPVDIVYRTVYWLLQGGDDDHNRWLCNL